MTTQQRAALCYYNPQLIERRDQEIEVDACIYGGNSSGVVAAHTLSRLGKSVALLEPGAHLGGLAAGGLSCTDFGRKEVIGGMAREFYRRLGAHYGKAEEWMAEPSAAEIVFQKMAAESGAQVFFQQFLAGVEKDGARIESISLHGGLRVRAKVFIDCSYEGDLMARAGVSYHVGREDNATYGETLNGAQVLNKHQFDLPVSPWREKGNPGSGLLPGIENTIPEIGAGDRRVQAYNFRLCVTKKAENRVPYPKPEKYDEREYELLARLLEAGFPLQEVMRKFDLIQGEKADKNNHGAVSTDFIGRNFDYPESDFATREKIFQAHVDYQMGLMWFLGNDARVPQNIRDAWQQWGLCRDEFPATGGWSHQLYIREARRMVSDYVMSETDCRGLRACNDPVGMAAYTMDSHNCRRWVERAQNGDARVMNEGDVQVGIKPYPVSYRSIVPHRGECENLWVPVCLASSHIAFGSIRMEPVFMILGQSAATAASMALDFNCSSQNVSYSDLRKQLERDGQVVAN